MKGRNLETLDETASVISAAKVTGTNVYNTAGDPRGEIHDVMIDKRSGKIAYAIMSFGGFLGIGEQYHPRRHLIGGSKADAAEFPSITAPRRA